MYIFVWFTLTSVFWARTASLLITIACDMSEGGQSVMLSASGLFIYCSRQALWWHITSAWEVWPVGDKRAWSLISDSSLRSDWPSPHQSSALLSAPAVIWTILSRTVCFAPQSAREHSFVREPMCFTYPFRIRARLCFHIAVIQFNSISTLSEANNSRFSSLRRDRVTLTYDSLAYSRVEGEGRITM